VRITVCLTRHWPEETTKDYKTEIGDNATIQDLIEMLPTDFYTRIETERYYKIRNSAFRFDSFFAIQFVIHDGQVIWMPSYDETRVDDFLETLQIPDNTIHMTTGISGRGGGATDLLANWQVVLGALSAISSIYTLKTMPQTAIHRIRSLKRRTKLVSGQAENHPGPFFSLILSRNHWNVNELADITGLTKDEAKNALRLCAYSYDRQQLMYVVTDKTTEVIDTLNKLSFPSPN
jgi:hypothetical protein